MLDKVKNTIEKYSMLRQGDKVLLAVSGGPDSIALLHCLWILKEKYDLSLAIIHINHCLRGKESDLDRDLVLKTAEKYQIPCFLESADINNLAQENHLSVETCARNVRQEIYYRYAKEENCQRIALGHNADDQVETILMRFLRGTGSRGLCGIAPLKEKIIRPLLELTKAEIENYCNHNKLEYRIDSSNLKPIYLRNKIRLDLLPLLEREYNSNMRGNLLRQREIALEDQAYWDQTSQKCLDEACLDYKDERMLLDWQRIEQLPSALLKRVLMQAIAMLKGDLQQISFGDLNLLLDFLLKKSQGRQILHEKIVFEKSYNQLCISLLKSSYQELALGKIEFFSFLPKPKKTGIIYIPFDPDLGPLEVRCRLPGDKIKTSGGTKKLKKFFNEKKVPSFQRDKLRVIAQKGNILWLEGFGFFNPINNGKNYAAISLAEED